VPETTAVYKLPVVLRPSNAITKLERVGNNSPIANFLIIKSSNQQIKTISELFLILLRIESKHKKTAESIATVFLSCANSLFLCTHQSIACKKKY
jgi:hypothetical protein